MPLLEIPVSKKITATITLEESTAILVDNYALFAKVSADDVVNKALEYVLNKDREFLRFCESSSGERPKQPLRVKRVHEGEKHSRPGRKPVAVLQTAATESKTR